MAQETSECPYCGACKELRPIAEEKDNGFWQVFCYGCGARGPNERKRGAAIKGWNQVAGKSLEPDR